MAKKSAREDVEARNAIEGRTRSNSRGAPEPDGRPPTAGPHADPGLVNPDATPGTGALPPPGEHDDADSTSS